LEAEPKFCGQPAARYRKEIWMHVTKESRWIPFLANRGSKKRKRRFINRAAPKIPRESQRIQSLEADGNGEKTGAWGKMISLGFGCEGEVSETQTPPHIYELPQGFLPSNLVKAGEPCLRDLGFKKRRKAQAFVLGHEKKGFT